jgi:hypothetical protein
MLNVLKTQTKREKSKERHDKRIKKKKQQSNREQTGRLTAVQHGSMET